MKTIYQIAAIFAICWASQFVERVLLLPFPAGVIGMVLLFLLLSTGLCKAEKLRPVSDFLLSNMAFFFIPAGVSIINYLDLLRASALRLVLICVLSTLLTFVATAWSVKFVMRLTQGREKR